MYAKYKYAIRLAVSWTLMYGLGLVIEVDVVRDWSFRHGLRSWFIQGWLVVLVAFMVYAVVTVRAARRAFRSEDA